MGTFLLVATYKAMAFTIRPQTSGPVSPRRRVQRAAKAAKIARAPVHYSILVRVLVAGGVTYVNAQPYPIEETNGLAALFDPSTLTWTTTGSMNKSRLGETMTPLLNGQVLVAGGETFDKHFGHLVPIASAELYTP
jgi:hypothetical protein